MLGLASAQCVQEQPAPEPPAPRAGRVVFADVAGWYQRTPEEVALLTPYDLTLDALPRGLPLAFGPWRGVDRPHDPAIDQWFRQPDVAVERTYTRTDGARVWLSAFGSRGRKSFHLFEHTPDTCYPLGGWSIERFGLARIALGNGSLPVNQGIATGPEGQLVFLYLYLWDTPVRDARHGVLSLRLAAPVRGNARAALAMLGGDFVARLFSGTIAWSRF